MTAYLSSKVLDLQNLIKQEVPKEHVIKITEKHLEGLKALPDDTADKEKEIAAISDFITELTKE